MSKTAFVFESIDPLIGSTGEDNMANESTKRVGAYDSNSTNKVVRVPTWFVSFIKIMSPAVGVLIAALVGYMVLRNDMSTMKKDVIPELKKELKASKDKIQDNKDRLLLMEVGWKGSAERVGKTLERIDKNLEKMDSKMEGISTTQHEIQTEVKVIQQQLKNNHP